MGDYFALDIGTTAIRVVQLSGGAGNWTLDRFASATIDIKTSNSDAAEDQRLLRESIMGVINQSGIKSRNVVLGAPSDKVFATVVDLPDLPENEIASVIKYQAEQYIPMDINTVKLDWALLGKSAKDQSKNEILLASMANSYSESRLDLIEGLGLNVLAIEPDSIALTRSLLPSGLPDARLILEIGEYSTDIVIAYGDTPRLIRTIPSGFQSIVKAATQNLSIDQAQATQFLQKFGVQEDKLEGQVYRAVQGVLDQFVGDIEKSVKFFQTKYPQVTIGGIIVSEYGSQLSGLKEFIGARSSLPVEIGNPWQKVRVNGTDQATLEPMKDHYAVAVGLAQRGGEE